MHKPPPPRRDRYVRPDVPAQAPSPPALPGTSTGFSLQRTAVVLLALNLVMVSGLWVVRHRQTAPTPVVQVRFQPEETTLLVPATDSLAVARPAPSRGHFDVASTVIQLALSDAVDEQAKRAEAAKRRASVTREDALADAVFGLAAIERSQDATDADATEAVAEQDDATTTQVADTRASDEPADQVATTESDASSKAETTRTVATIPGALPDVSASCHAEMSLPRRLGTSIHWEEDLETAAATAKRQDRLVFLLHVSGNFAREEFT